MARSLLHGFFRGVLPCLRAALVHVDCVKNRKWDQQHRQEKEKGIAYAPKVVYLQQRRSINHPPAIRPTTAGPRNEADLSVTANKEKKRASCVCRQRRTGAFTHRRDDLSVKGAAVAIERAIDLISAVGYPILRTSPNHMLAAYISPAVTRPQRCDPVKTPSAA